MCAQRFTTLDCYRRARPRAALVLVVMLISTSLASAQTPGTTTGASTGSSVGTTTTYSTSTDLGGGTVSLLAAIFAGGTVSNGTISASSQFQGTGQATVSVVLAGTGALSVYTQSGAAAPVLTLTGTNTFTGGTTVTGGYVVFNALANFGAGTGSGASPGSGSVTLNGGGLRWASGNTADVSGNLAALGASGAKFDTNGNNVTFSTALSGTGALTKEGTGTLTLSGTNTYSGATTISAGELKLNGSATSSAFTVSGGILSGNGTVGALTIGSGGTLSPGNSPGTLSAGNTTFGGGGSYLWEINKTAGTAGADPGWDLLSISGTLAITANSSSKFTINLTSLTLGNAAGQVGDFNSSSNYSFTFVTTTGGITGFDPSVFNISTTNFQNPFTGTWSIGQSGNNLTLNYTMSAVPEPSTYAAWTGAACLALASWRRRAALSGAIPRSRRQPDSRSGESGGDDCGSEPS